MDVYAINKITGEREKIVYKGKSEDDAERFCEQWGWNYDDGHRSYWLEIDGV